MFSATYSLQTFEYFLLILVRISACVFVAPYFNIRGVPARTKIGMAGCIAILLTGVLPDQNLAYTGIMEYGVIVIKEGITGLLIGYSASICNSIVLFAGSLIDMQIGLSMAQEFNPMTMMNESITGNLYNYMVMLMLIVSGMHEYLLKALAETFTLIPVNGAVFQMDSLMNSMVRFLSEYIIIGFRICLPIFATMILLNAVLGILAKVAPQMNMFAVGIQLKVLTGLTILFFTVGMLPGASDFIFTQMKKIVVSFVEGMM